MNDENMLKSRKFTASQLADWKDDVRDTGSYCLHTLSDT